MIIYEFLKVILVNEYKNICQKHIKIADENKNKIKKVRRKNILIEVENV